MVSFFLINPTSSERHYSMNRIRNLTLSLIFFLFLFENSLQALNPEIISSGKKGVVSIQGRASHAAYNSTGTWSGTGFIVDKKKGYILTNKHVIGASSASTFEVTFFNGQEVDATILYMDPLQDFGFLKVDPDEIPDDVEALSLKDDLPSLNQNVIMIGKNEGQNFSINVGRVSGLYGSVGHFPNQTLRISLNAQGGASGSPVINEDGDVIALTHSSNLSSASFALPIGYIIEALEGLGEEERPKRQFLGFILVYHSLDRASKFNSFPKDLIKKYMADYPDALNQGLLVDRVFERSPADGKVEIGDVVWAVNREKIGPNLLKFQKIVNASTGQVLLTLYRGDKKIDVKIKPYDLQKNRVRRMVSFGGATFYEADHFIRLITGTPYGAVFMTNILPGSSFYDQFPPISGTTKLFVKIAKMDGKPIKSLDDLIALIPDLKEKEDFYVAYYNYAFYMGHNQTPIFSNHQAIAEVSYVESDGKAQLLEFDPNKGKYTLTEIG